MCNDRHRDAVGLSPSRKKFRPLLPAGHTDNIFGNSRASHHSLESHYKHKFLLLLQNKPNMVDEDESLSHASSEGEGGVIEERDETHEVKKRTHRETANVVRWRNVVTGGLICTALAVVISMFLFLKREETELFETAVSWKHLQRRKHKLMLSFSSNNSAARWQMQLLNSSPR